MNDRQRLEAIVAVVCKYLPPDGISREEAMSQIIGLVDPLPAQPEQEPVAYLDAVDSKTVYVAPNRKRWLDPHEDKEWLQFHYDHPHDTPLYAAPPSKSWVSLTDEDFDNIYKRHDTYDSFAHAIEAKLKEKNT